ncbi:MAG: helix-turn-helix transcriptional regulator [Wujia sp.]
MDYIDENYNVIMEQKTDEMTRNLVNRLVAYRKALGMTQQDIADKTGIKRPNVARFEGCKYTPTFDIVMKYANAVNVDLTFELSEKPEVKDY